MTLALSTDEVLATTLAVRKRLDVTRLVPREVLEECLELALQAPNGANRNEWRWLIVDDRAKGPAYAVSTELQRRRIIDAARCSGLIFDPVYTGKAMSGLWDLCDSGELRGKRVLFLHTGGLPGLLAAGTTFTSEV